MRILMCVNAYACVCKVPSNICRVKEATVAEPTGVSHLGYLVYTCVGLWDTDKIDKKNC